MAAPSLLRSRSFWIGLLATIFIVGMWARSLVRMDVAEGTTGRSGRWGIGSYDASLVICPPSAPGSAAARPEFTFFSERADIVPHHDASAVPRPVRVFDCKVFGKQILIAWWLVLAVHLMLWAAVMAWRHRLRKRAEFPPTGSGEARE